MTTFDQLVGRVKRQLLGYALSQESVSELTEAMAADDTTFTVDAGDVQHLGRGLVEVDDELILVRSFDANSGTVTVMGGTRGRGYQETTAAAHDSGSLVTTSPAYPRQAVKDAINDCIRGMYPDLPILDSTEITRISVVYQYELPAETQGIRSVTGELLGPTKVWRPMPNYRFVPDANTADFPTGKAIQLLDEIVPGQKYRIVYEKQPSALVSGLDEFTATGYPERAVDVVVWGACARLAPAYESGRLQQRAVEANERSRIVGKESALQTAAYYQALYEQALQREQDRLFTEHPTFQTFQG